MSPAEVDQALRLALDRIDTLSNPDLNVAERDFLITEAQELFIKKRFAPMNPNAPGFEQSQKRIDDLSTLVVKTREISSTLPTLIDNGKGVYELKLSGLTPTYMFMVAGSADLKISTNCTKNVPLHLMPHDDYRDAMRDPFNKSSEEFILYNVGMSSDASSSSIFVYSPSITVTAVYPDYIRKPKRFFSAVYSYTPDGSTSSVQGLELPEHTHQEVVDLAAALAAMNIESPEYIKLKGQRFSEFSE